MIVVDTSVTVAGFADWHARHRAARAVLDRGPRLIAQVALETYSVLTRLPGPHRAPADRVQAYLAAFPGPWLVLDGNEVPRFVAHIERAGITGGATYDALIAETARTSGAILISRDRRAEPTYRRMGVKVELID